MQRIRFIVGLFLLVALPTGTAPAQTHEHAVTAERVLDPIDFPLGPTLAALAPDATPEAIFRSLSDEVGVNLYAGLQRGHLGVIHARSGNSLEQSLLLANLLNGQGIETRLGHAELTDALAAELLAHQRAYFTVLAGSALADPRAGLRALAETRATDYAMPMIRDAARTLVEIEHRYASLLRDGRELLDGLLGPEDPGRDIDNEIALTEIFLALARDHYWVQMKSGDAWIDLDPTLGLAWGEAAVPPDRTLSLADAVVANTHWVKVAVEATYQIPGQGRRTGRHLELQAPLDSLAGHPLFLVHPAKNEPLFSLVDFNILNAQQTGGIDYAPSLIGAGRVFAGSVLRIESWDPAAAFFGGEKPRFLSEELVVHLQAPDGTAEEYRRHVVDLVEPGERVKQGDWAHGTLASDEGALDAEGNPVVAIPLALRATHALSFRTYPALANDYVPFGLIDSEEIFATGYHDLLLTLGGLLDEFHRYDEVRRARFGEDAVALPLTVNLTLLVMRGAVDEEDADLHGTYGLDLVKTDLAPVFGGDLFANSFLALVNEQSFIEVVSGKDVTGAPVFSALTVLAAAREQGISLLSVEAGGLAGLPGWTEADLALIGPLEPGERVVVPAAPVAFQGLSALAWLVVDGESGALVDGTDIGARAGMVEYIKNAKGAFKAARAMCMFRQCAELAYNTAKSVVTLLRGKISFGLIQDLAASKDLVTDCSRVRIRMKLYKRWGKKPPKTNKDRDAQEKIEAMQQAARDKKLKTHDDSTYDGLRKKDPSEFGSQRESDLNRKKRKDEDWDHRLELGCGGSHSSGNVFPLDSSVNKSLGNFFGAVCRKLCEGTSIEEIVIDYVLPGGPGQGKKP